MAWKFPTSVSYPNLSLSFVHPENLSKAHKEKIRKETGSKRYHRVVPLSYHEVFEHNKSFSSPPTRCF